MEGATAEFTIDRVKDMAMNPKEAQKYLTLLVERATPAKTSDPRIASPLSVKKILLTEAESASDAYFMDCEASGEKNPIIKTIVFTDSVIMKDHRSQK